MSIRHSMIYSILAATCLIVSPVFAAEQLPSAKTAELKKLEIGEKMSFPGFDITLNTVVRPSEKNAVGGEDFTEYNFTIRNTFSEEKELLLTDIAMMVGGDRRHTIKSIDEIVRQKENKGQDDSGLVAGGVGAGAGFLSSALAMVDPTGGLLAAAAGSIGSELILNKMYYEEPVKWANEINKRAFKGATKDGLIIFPGDSLTGSDWVKQAAGEKATHVIFFFRIGGTPKLVRMVLKDDI